LGIFTGLVAGDYDVMVKDASNCESAGNTLSIVEPEALMINTEDHGNTCPGNNDGTITLVASGGTTPLSYILKEENVRIDSNSHGAFTGLGFGTFSVEVNDINNCGPILSNAIEIIQGDNCELIIYDAFSPNDDGHNDYWNIQGILAYPECVVKVFNNWGSLVFTSPMGYPSPWDGKFNGNSLPAGTYYYVIDLGDGSSPLSGAVNIIK